MGKVINKSELFLNKMVENGWSILDTKDCAFETVKQAIKEKRYLKYNKRPSILVPPQKALVKKDV